MSNQLVAFQNDKNIKQKYLARLKAHVKANELVHGYYWKNGKGCAIGCTIHSNIHNTYETELGLPEWLARLEDRLFEGMNNGDAKTFPVTFLKAIPVGAKKFDRVKWQFCSYLLKENLERVLRLNIPDKLKTQVVNAIRKVLNVHTKALNKGMWNRSVARNAESAVARAESAAARATRSAGSAKGAAWSAARSAAASAASVASAAGVASAVASAVWSAAASVTRSAAWSAAYKHYADKLIELLQKME